MNNTILIKSYNRNAPNYDKKFKYIQTSKYIKLITNNYLIKYDKILDLGCGTGLLYDYMLERAAKLPDGAQLPEYFGIDFSGEMIREAKAKNIKNAVTGNILNLPYKDNFFNAVFSFTVIGLSDDPPEKIFIECCRVLKPGGIFVLTMLKNIFSESIKNMLALSGFTIVKLDSDCGQDIGITAEKK